MNKCILCLSIFDYTIEVGNYLDFQSTDYNCIINPKVSKNNSTEKSFVYENRVFKHYN